MLFCPVAAGSSTQVLDISSKLRTDGERGFLGLTFSAEGSFMYSEDGREYLDFFSGAGALNYGHNHPDLLEPLLDYLREGGIVHSLDKYTTAKRTFLERFAAAARGLVARGGAAELSMGDVASAAHVSKALVHYHFHDKDSLLVALAERYSPRASEIRLDGVVFGFMLALSLGVALLLSFAGAIVAFAGFSLVRDGERLRIRRGLLARR